ncbi:MAG: apolipoprotein N-acyltransferase [Candidatus Omnitrophica bacterium]|nr:apolipoprotein N-acyltransferase [Candidatus Omnitrophota bacterium]
MLRKMISFALSSIAAILLSLSFSSFNLWQFAWFGFIPLFIALENKTLRQSLLIAYICGIIFWSFTIYWLVHVTLLGQIILILYLSLYFAAFGLCLTLARRASANGVLLIPCFWVLFEYIRSHLFTGFPWALAAFSQYKNLPVIQIADITGAWGVSFLVLLVNVLIYAVIRRSLKPKVILVFTAVFFLSLVYGFYKLNYNSKDQAGSQPFKISVIGGNIAQDIKWNKQAVEFIQKNYEELTAKAALDSPDLIIWPEASVPALWGEDEAEFKRLYSFVRSLKVDLLVGAVSHYGGKYYNSALFINKAGVPQIMYNKLHLVPFGEFVPLKNVFRFLEAIAPIGDITPGKKYTIFEKPAPFGVLICFEDLFPELSRQFVKKGAKFLVNITNDAWYKQTSAAHQHLAASVFRAVENRVNLARSANTGVSGFIDPVGRLALIRGEAGQEIFIKGYNTRNIYLGQNQPTFYNHFGDFFVFICAFFAILGLIPALKNKK